MEIIFTKNNNNSKYIFHNLMKRPQIIQIIKLIVNYQLSVRKAIKKMVRSIQQI